MPCEFQVNKLKSQISNQDRLVKVWLSDSALAAFILSCCGWGLQGLLWLNDLVSANLELFCPCLQLFLFVFFAFCFFVCVCVKIKLKDESHSLQGMVCLAEREKEVINRNLNCKKLVTTNLGKLCFLFCFFYC